MRGILGRIIQICTWQCVDNARWICVTMVRVRKTRSGVLLKVRAAEDVYLAKFRKNTRFPKYSQTKRCWFYSHENEFMKKLKKNIEQH